MSVEVSQSDLNNQNWYAEFVLGSVAACATGLCPAGETSTVGSREVRQVQQTKKIIDKLLHTEIDVVPYEQPDDGIFYLVSGTLEEYSLSPPTITLVNDGGNRLTIPIAELRREKPSGDGLQAPIEVVPRASLIVHTTYLY